MSIITPVYWKSTWEKKKSLPLSEVWELGESGEGGIAVCTGCISSLGITTTFSKLIPLLSSTFLEESGTQTEIQFF